MKEERLTISSQEFALYVAQAKELRTQEVSRISREFFRLPQKLVNRLFSKDTLTVDLDNNNVNQSA